MTNRSTAKERATARAVAKRFKDQDRRIRDLARKPQLQSSSIENGALTEYDADGGLASVIGKQFDGSHGAYPLLGPLPPTPAAPIAAGAVGGLTIRWDGFFLGADGLPDVTVAPPMDFSRVEVHVSPEPDFDPVFADTLVGTIETPRGAEVQVALPIGAYFVRFVTRTLPGKTSDPSPEVTAEVLPIEGTRLAADAIDGKVITGPLIRSSADAATAGGWQFDDAGLRFWAPGGRVTLQADRDTGSVTATGTFQTNPSGPRVKLSNRAAAGALDMYADDTAAHGALFTSTPPSGLTQSTFRHYTTDTEWSYQYAITPNSWIIGSPTYQMIRGIEDGDVRYISSNAILDREYTLASNVVVTANGIMGRSTSKRANKLDIQPTPEDWDERLLSLSSSTWYDRMEVHEQGLEVDEEGAPIDPPPSLRRVPGMIAEDVEAAGLTEFVTYGRDGAVEGLMYERLGVALIPVVARQRDRIAALERRVAEQETQTAALLERLDRLEAANGA